MEGYDVDSGQISSGGHTETIILARLMGSDNYGYEINKAIQQKTSGKYELKEATLYSAFRRLGGSRLHRILLGATKRQAPGGGYYRITEIGREAYESLKKEWKIAKELIDNLIEWEEK